MYFCTRDVAEFTVSTMDTRYIVLIYLLNILGEGVLNTFNTNYIRSHYIKSSDPTSIFLFKFSATSVRVVLC